MTLFVNGLAQNLSPKSSVLKHVCFEKVACKRMQVCGIASNGSQINNKRVYTTINHKSDIIKI